MVNVLGTPDVLIRGRAGTAFGRQLLSKDEARRIAANIANVIQVDLVEHLVDRTALLNLRA